MESELKKAWQDNRTKHMAALRELIPRARAAVNVLKDAGQKTTAAELEAQLFAVESLDAEMLEIAKREPEAFLRMLAEGLDGAR